MEVKQFEIYSDKNVLKGKHYGANVASKKDKIILMCHGFAGTQDLFLPKYAEKFSLAGFDVITFDYNGFGESEGEIEIVPENQMRDISNVALYLRKNEENPRLLTGSFLNNRDKNPVLVRGRDFYFLLLTSSLLPH